MILHGHGGVTIETLRGFREQVGSHGQVGLSPRNVDVTQIGRQQRKAGLDIGSLAIPGDESVDGEGMAQIVKPRLPARVR